MEIYRRKEDTIDISRGETVFSDALDISRGGIIIDDSDDSSSENIIIDPVGSSSSESVFTEKLGGSSSSEVPYEAITSTLSLSLSLSSDRFVFNESPDEEDSAVDCINNSEHMFTEFKKKPPTLEEALRSMEYGDERVKEFSKDFMKRGEDKLDEFDAPGLTAEDIAAIFCYTYECSKKEKCEGIESPYRMLNNSVSVNRDNKSLKKTRGFLFLLLQALRKLPRYTSVNGVLYRGIKAHVQTEMDPEYPKRKPYAAGNEKMLWAFASTTEDLERTRVFLGKTKGTLFTISGKPWGYDISMFSDFPDEKEIILEPERKLKIKSVSREGDIISVNAEMVKTPLVLEGIIKVKAVKIKEKKSKNKETPGNFRAVNNTETTAVELSWSEPRGVKEDKDILSYQVSVKKAGGGRLFNRNAERLLVTRGNETKLTARNLEMGERYEFRVRCKFRDGWGIWGEKVTFLKENLLPKDSAWKKCPEDVDEDSKYSVDEKDPRIATKIGADDYCTIIGNTPLPLNQVTSWSIRILESCNNDGGGIYIGVAPFDINQNENWNFDSCGWYFACWTSTLCSGPPHNYNKKEYGPREEDGEYVHTGDIVGVVMDTSKGELSFVLNGMNLGVAYEGIPLDKPLVPCVLLKYYGDSVELCVDGVKECTVDPSIPAPSKITANGTAWDSISLSWKSVRRASFYQIEVDGALMSVSKKTNFTKGSLLPKVEHTFRVRAVKGAFLGAWSDVVKEKTVEILPEFGECTWKKCPSGMEKGMRYSVDASNPRIVEIIELKTLFGGNVKVKCASIIGNAPLPINKVTLWSIKMLKSSDNGGRFFIGVAPFDIDQYEKWNREKCGWYFDCYYSQLWSGPPHNYRMKKYGEWKGWRNYVYAGNTVGVVMDTTKGELSFIVKDVNFGVAFEGIPLDKPLMPCMILWSSGISVELVL